MKIVINSDFGGFGLSDEAMRGYLSRKFGKDGFYEEGPDKNGFFHFYVNGEYFNEHDIPRDDPVLIEIVEKMGADASGRYASLKVVEIPDDVEWYVEEYDGREQIAEKHRVWY